MFILLAHFEVKLILGLTNSLAHNKISQISYSGPNYLQSAAYKNVFSDNLTPLGVTFTLLRWNNNRKNQNFQCIDNYEHIYIYIYIK